jgi:hypothetical protein
MTKKNPKSNGEIAEKILNIFENVFVIAIIIYIQNI